MILIIYVLTLLLCGNIKPVPILYSQLYVQILKYNLKFELRIRKLQKAPKTQK